MRILILTLCALPLLSACGKLQWNSTILAGGATLPAAADTATSSPAATDPAAAAAEAPLAAPAGSFTGSARTVAALGDPSLPGLWMETPLVASEQRARLRSARGTEVIVTLKPIPGEATAGSRLSIGAMRALGAPLTELVELQVLPAG